MNTPSPPLPEMTFRAPSGRARLSRPILLVLNSVNQMLPSGPVVMKFGWLLEVGTAYSVMIPAGVIRPILLPLISVNQMLPSGPLVMPNGYESGVNVGYSTKAPE